MQYKPDQKEIEYIQHLKKSNKDTLNKKLVGANSMILAVSCPEEVDAEMVKLYGGSWHNNEKILTKFMRQNPQYVVAKPL